jgi:hypothetical protein
MINSSKTLNKYVPSIANFSFLILFREEKNRSTYKITSKTLKKIDNCSIIKKPWYLDPYVESNPDS